MNKSYNEELIDLRNEKNLSIKEAAKEIGISRFSLFLYENGYFKPNKNVIEKIENFYGKSIDLNTYPTSTMEEAIEKPKAKRKRMIVSGVIALLSLSLFITGFSLFSQSVSNKVTGYGEIYNETRDKAIQSGKAGRDLVTDLEYHSLSTTYQARLVTFTFYSTSSMLYFNNSTASVNSVPFNHPEYHNCRYHYQLGGSLDKSSYLCTFNFGCSTTGTYFIAEGILVNKICEKLSSLTIVSKGSIDITEELVLEILNEKMDDNFFAFDYLLKESLGKEVSYYDDFLPAREQGRTTNYSKQISGLIIVFPSLIAFYISLAIIIITLLSKIKAPLSYSKVENPLPKDLNINFGIPDFIMIWVSRVMAFGSLALLILCILGKFLIKLPPLFGDEKFMNFLQICFVMSPFIRQFVSFNTIKKEKTLYIELARYTLIYLCVATIETAIISITNLWGYNITDLIYKYIPGNIFLAVALNYLLYLFLFITPTYIQNKKKYVLVLWRLLSLIPLGIIIVSIIVGNSYNLFYGVKKNIFLLFWLTNQRAILSIVYILFIYAIFFIKLYFTKKHQNDNFFNGNTYNLVINIACTLIIVIVALIDLAFKNNEVAYYIGIGNNYWLFALIPFILFTKFGVNTIRISHMDDDTIVGVVQ